MEALGAHLAYLQSLVASGQMVLAGPCEDGSLGIAVFPRSDAAAAEALMQQDPCVARGVMRCEVKPFRISLFGTGSKRDWLGFTMAIHIQTTAAAAWRMIATCDGLERWFLRRAEAWSSDGREWPRDRPVEAGAKLRMTWLCAGECDARGVAVPVELSEDQSVQRTEPPQRLRHGWYEDRGWVEYRIVPHAIPGRITVELEQRMNPTADFAFLEGAYVGCQQGWTFFLTNLKSVLEHGTDLREPAPDRKGIVNL